MSNNENTNPNAEKQEMNTGKKKKAVVAAVLFAGVLAAGGIGTYAYQNGKVELKQDQITVEYGSKMPTDAEYYMEGKEIALKGVEIDVSKVDTEKVGTYNATATKGKNSYSFQVVVEDTVKPKVVLKEYLYAIAGRELKSSEMIETMSDLAGIKSLSFKEAQVEIKDTKESKEKVPVIALKYDKQGLRKNTLTVEDNNGNKTEVEFELNVVGSYVGDVKNLKSEWNILKDAKNIDYMKEIQFDKTKVKSVTVDAKKVDTSKTGKYPIIYTVESVSGEKSVITIIVNVVTKDEAKDLVTNGDKVYTTDNKEFNGKTEETKEETKKEDTKKEDSKKEDSKKENSKDSNKKEDKETTDKKNNATTGNNSGSNNGTSGNSGSNSSSSNSGSSSNTGSNSGSNNSSQGHKHTWVAQYETVHHKATGHTNHVQTGTIHHDATGYYQEITESRYVCNVCGYNTNSAEDIMYHTLDVCGGGYGVYPVVIGNEWIETTPAWDEPVYEDRWVEDSPAWDEQVLIGNVCSVCGKKQ